MNLFGRRSKSDALATGGLRRVEVDLRELTEADVTYLSLVKRGANRTPFKIVKREDDPMLNFGKAFKAGALFQKADVTPTVGAIIVDKASAESLIPQIQEAGFAVIGDPVEQDNLVILKMVEEYDSEDALVVKMSENIACVVTNAKKMFMAFPNSTQFRENIEAMGFLPGVHMAQEALNNTMYNILDESTTKAESVRDLGAALDDFRTHVIQLMETVPEKAFKLENIKVAPTTKAAPAAPAQKPAAASEGDTGDTDTTSKGEDSEKDKEDTAKAGEIETPDPDDEGPDTVMRDLTNQLMNSVNSALADLRNEFLEPLSALKAEIAEVKDESVNLRKETERVEAEKAALQAAVRGTVASGSTTEDTPPRGETRKTQGDDDTGIFESAFKWPGESAIEDR